MEEPKTAIAVALVNCLGSGPLVPIAPTFPIATTVVCQYVELATVTEFAKTTVGLTIGVAVAVPEDTEVILVPRACCSKPIVRTTEPLTLQHATAIVLSPAKILDLKTGSVLVPVLIHIKESSAKTVPYLHLPAKTTEVL